MRQRLEILGQVISKAIETHPSLFTLSFRPNFRIYIDFFIVEYLLVYEIDVRTPHFIGRNSQNRNVVVLCRGPRQPVVRPVLGWTERNKKQLKQVNPTDIKENCHKSIDGLGGVVPDS